MNKLIKNKKGFTLIELIIVIAIIAILAAVLMPRFGGFTDSAKEKACLLEAKNVATAIDAKIAEGSYDSSDVSEIADLAGVETTSISDLQDDGGFTYDNGDAIAGRSAQDKEVTVNITPTPTP